MNSFYAFLLSTLFLVYFFIFSSNIFGFDVFTAEGSIKYLGKPTYYSRPFVLLSSLQRFYVTEEIYSYLSKNDISKKYFYFVMKNNVITSLYDSPFKGYIYYFPPIKEVRRFEFNDYITYYVIFYYNFSPYVNIYPISNDVQIFYTSSNSLTLKVKKYYSGKTIVIRAEYRNGNFVNFSKYVIKV